MKFNRSDILSSIRLLEDKWKSIIPDKPIEILFLDDQIKNMYTSEIKISKIFNVLATLSIFISCLGLFGLSSFMAERRTKEVGIRKVMGARLIDIISLQMKEFVLLMLVANIFVWPLVLWWGNNWLNKFAYHLEISPMIFILTLFGAVFLVIITLFYHSLKISRTNPVTALRYE